MSVSNFDQILQAIKNDSPNLLIKNLDEFNQCLEKSSEKKDNIGNDNKNKHEEDDNAGCDIHEIEIPFLQIAIKNNSVKCFNKLIETGADINERSKRNFKTALHRAAEVGNLYMIQTLIAAGIDIKAYNAHGETAIFSAARKNHPEVIPEFIKAGLGINSLNAAIRTPLTVGIITEGLPIKFINFFVENGAFIQSELIDYFDKIDIDSIKNEEERVIIENIRLKSEIWKDMKNNTFENLGEISISEQLFDGYDMLESAVNQGSLHSIQVVLKLFNDTLMSKTSALAMAVELNNTEFMRTLLDANAPVNNKSRLTGDTALIAAIKAIEDLNDPIFAEIYGKSDIRIKNDEGFSPLQICIMRQNDAVAQKLMNDGIEPTPEDIELARHYISYGFLKMLNIPFGEQRPMRFPQKTNKMESLMCIVNDDAEKLKELFENEVEKNSPLKLEPESLFLSAANCGAVNCLRFLAPLGGDPNAVLEMSEMTPLKYAAMNNSVETVMALLELGADVKLKMNKTTIDYAVHHRNLEMVKALVEAGFDPNTKYKISDYEKTTALNVSIEIAANDIFQYLVALPNINFNSEYQTIDKLKRISSRNNNKEAYLFFNNGSLDGFLKDSPIMDSIIYDIQNKKLRNVEKYGKMFEDVGDDDGQTILHHCCKQGFFEGVKYLIENCNYNLDKQDNKGNTPLIYAASSSSIEIIKLLLEHGASPNITNDDGLAPLAYSLDTDARELKQLLIEITDPELLLGYISVIAEMDQFDIFVAVISRCDEPERAKDLYESALIGGNTEIIEWIEENCFASVKEFRLEKKDRLGNEKRPKPTPELLDAISNGDYDGALNIITEAEVDFDFNVEIEGRVPLVEAVNTKSKKLVMLLLNCLANPNFGFPLFAALKKKQKDIAKLLIKSEADINIRNNKGETPIFSAINSGDPATVSFAIDNGADVNVLSSCKASPIYTAVCLRNTEIVKILIAAGAVPQKGEMNPYRQAKTLKLTEIEELLKGAGFGVGIGSQSKESLPKLSPHTKERVKESQSMRSSSKLPQLKTQH